MLLLDEPLAALDLKLRQHMLGELRAIHEAAGITFIYVTHDQTEAMGLSDRIAVMNAGRIEQLGPPGEIYDSPRTRFVAGFIGDANFLTARSPPRVRRPSVKSTCPDLGKVFSTESTAFPAGTQVEVIVRPERIQLMEPSPDPARGLNVFAAVIEDIMPLGAITRCSCGPAARASPASSRARTMRTRLAKGSKVLLRFDSDDVRVMPRNDGTLPSESSPMTTGMSSFLTCQRPMT